MSRNEIDPAVKAESETEAPKAASVAPKKAKGKISRARTIVLLAVFLSIVVGLIVGNGWGTLSSMGVGAIAYLCPLGALETLAAGHSPLLRTILALVCALAVVALIGRAFCAWVCPVPPLRHFFRPNADKKDPSVGADQSQPSATTEVAPGTPSVGADQGLPSVAAKVAPGTPSVGADLGQPSATTKVAPETPSVGADLGQPSATTKVAPLTAEESATLTAGCGGASGKGHSCASCSSCGLPPVGGARDGLQLDSRHGVLVGALASSAIFGFPVFCLICPVGLSIAVVVGVYRALFQHDPTISLLIFAAILLAEVVFFRKWCHKICPLGALMSLVGAKAPLLRPRVAADKCLREQGIDCQACVKACPEKLDPHSASIPECSKCGLCAEACPVGAISFRKRKTALAGASAADERPAPLDGGRDVKDKHRDVHRGTEEPAPAFAEDLDFEESPVT